MVLNRRPPICGPQTVIPLSCVLVGSARVHQDLSFLEQFANSHFAGCRSQDCTKMVCSKFTAKRRVDSENQQFKEEWTEKCAFILPPTSTRPMCLICQETIAVMKISNLKWHHETKHRNFEETFPENVCEWGGFWVSTRSHSCRSKKKVHD